MILDRIGTRYTFTCAFLFMGPLTISLHFTKWSRYGYLANLCSATFCTGIFTCIAPACQELFGRRDLSLKYAASLVALGFGCLLFFLLQLGEKFLFGELAFLSMIGVPCMVASVLAFATLSGWCFNFEKKLKNSQHAYFPLRSVIRLDMIVQFAVFASLLYHFLIFIVCFLA